jgi:putative transposase
MQGVGRDYVRAFNRRHGRSGTLWEGRYRSTLVQAERHLLPCMVFIDLDPVREGLCAEAAQHAWSSHRHHTGLAQDRGLTPHAMYWALGNTPFAREAAYAELVRTGLHAQQMGAIAEALWHGWVLGDAGYLATLARDTDRRLSPARAGRPKKSKS